MTLSKKDYIVSLMVLHELENDILEYQDKQFSIGSMLISFFFLNTVFHLQLPVKVTAFKPTLNIRMMLCPASFIWSTHVKMMRTTAFGKTQSSSEPA